LPDGKASLNPFPVRVAARTRPFSRQSGGAERPGQPGQKKKDDDKSQLAKFGHKGGSEGGEPAPKFRNRHRGRGLVSVFHYPEIAQSHEKKESREI